jgi:putative flippase GtrA
MRQLIRQATRFGMVGLVNTGVGLLAIYAVLYFAGTGPMVANTVGYAIGLALSFLLNRVWTFEHRGTVGRVLPRYLLVATIAFVCNLAVVFIGTHYLGINAYMIQPGGIIVYTAIMFFGCRHYVFTSVGNGADTG